MSGTSGAKERSWFSEIHASDQRADPSSKRVLNSALQLAIGIISLE